LIKITAFVRPNRLESVKIALGDIGIGGLTIVDVRGSGNSPETAGRLGPNVISLPPKSKLMVVIPDDLLEPALHAIETHARTGEAGDGKVFWEIVEQSMRIRTSETGEDAI